MPQALRPRGTRRTLPFPRHERGSAALRVLPCADPADPFLTGARHAGARGPGRPWAAWTPPALPLTRVLLQNFSKVYLGSALSSDDSVFKPLMLSSARASGVLVRSAAPRSEGGWAASRLPLLVSLLWFAVPSSADFSFFLLIRLRWNAFLFFKWFAF